MSCPQPGVDPATAPSASFTPPCMWVDCTRAPGVPAVDRPCPGVPVWDVLTECSAGRHQKAGPTCNRHFGLLEMGRPDLSGHLWRIVIFMPLGAA